MQYKIPYKLFIPFMHIKNKSMKHFMWKQAVHITWNGNHISISPYVKYGAKIQGETRLVSAFPIPQCQIM